MNRNTAPIIYFTTPSGKNCTLYGWLENDNTSETEWSYTIYTQTGNSTNVVENGWVTTTPDTEPDWQEIIDNIA